MLGEAIEISLYYFCQVWNKISHAHVILQAPSLSLYHYSDEQHVLSAADIAQTLVLKGKRDERQFVVKL